MSRSTMRALTVCVGVGLAAQAQAAVQYSGGTYSQEFDTLPNTPVNQSLGPTPSGWTDDNAAPGTGNFSVVGWYIYHPTVQAEGGFNGHQRVRVSGTPTTAATGSFYAYGDNATTSPERALGVVPSATLTPANGRGVLRPAADE